MNTVRRNRRAVNDSALAQENSIQDALHLDLHQFKFVLHMWGNWLYLFLFCCLFGISFATGRMQLYANAVTISLINQLIDLVTL